MMKLGCGLFLWDQAMLISREGWSKKPCMLPRAAGFGTAKLRPTKISGPSESEMPTHYITMDLERHGSEIQKIKDPSNCLFFMDLKHRKIMKDHRSNKSGVTCAMETGLDRDVHAPQMVWDEGPLGSRRIGWLLCLG